MKIDRLLNEFEFELKDFSQYKSSRLNLKEPVYIKILDLRINQINYDGFYQGEISSLTIKFSDYSSDPFHLNYKPGIIKGLDQLDSLINEYNSVEDKKFVFQKMKLFGENHGFSVRNQTKFTYPQKNKKTQLFEENFKLLKSFLDTKKLNKKLEYEEISGNAFQLVVYLKNKTKIFIRVSSFVNPIGTFEKIIPFISIDMNKLTNKYGLNQSNFFLFQPDTSIKKNEQLKYAGSNPYGGIKSLEKFLQEKTDIK